MGWGDILTGVGNLAGTAWSIYQGSQSNETASKYYDKAGDAANKQAALGEAQWNRYKNVFGPLEEAQVKEALLDIEAYKPVKAAILDETERNIMEYRPIEDSMISEAKKSGAEYGQQFASQSSADVNQAFGRTKAIDARSMGRMGINPNSGRFADRTKAITTSQALADAGGRTTAFRQGDDVAYNRKTNALNYRRGMPMAQMKSPSGNATLSSAMTGLSSGTNATAGLAGVAGAAGSASNQTAGYMFGQGVGAIGKDMNATGANQAINWGGIKNSISGMFSSNPVPQAG